MQNRSFENLRITLYLVQTCASRCVLVQTLKPKTRREHHDTKSNEAARVDTLRHSFSSGEWRRFFVFVVVVALSRFE